MEIGCFLCPGFEYQTETERIDDFCRFVPEAACPGRRLQRKVFHFPQQANAQEIKVVVRTALVAQAFQSVEIAVQFGQVRKMNRTISESI